MTVWEAVRLWGLGVISLGAISLAVISLAVKSPSGVSRFPEGREGMMPELHEAAGVSWPHESALTGCMWPFREFPNRLRKAPKGCGAPGPAAATAACWAGGRALLWFVGEARAKRVPAS